MRIDGLTQVNQVYRSVTPKKVYQKQSSYEKDEFQISGFAKDLQTAKAALNEVSDVRADKVAYFKEAVASGTYNVSSQAIADKLVSNYYDTLF